MNIGEIRMSDLENGEHLEHYGVLGMKWGVRRYQNADGSLTAEGKAHYGGENSGADKVSKKEKSSYDSGSKNWKKKDARKLSDEELNRRNSRLQREKQYKDMTEPPMLKETKQAAKKIFVGAATGAASGAMAVKYKALITAGGTWLAGAASAAYLAAKVGGYAALWLL